MSPTYLSLGAFYASEPARDISREQDVGLYWRGVGSHPPTFRAAWIHDTGELYVMQHEGTLGGGRVDVVGHFTDAVAVDDALGGWREVCGDPESLTWLVARVPDVPDHLRRAAGLDSATAAGVIVDPRPIAFGFGAA